MFIKANVRYIIKTILQYQNIPLEFTYEKTKTITSSQQQKHTHEQHYDRKFLTGPIKCTLRADPELLIKTAGSKRA